MHNGVITKFQFEGEQDDSCTKYDQMTKLYIDIIDIYRYSEIEPFHYKEDSETLSIAVPEGDENGESSSIVYES